MIRQVGVPATPTSRSGKLLGPIIDEQLDAALDLHPDLVSFAGGGNDILRPRSDLPSLLRLVDLAVARLVDSGATVVIFTGADPCDGLPWVTASGRPAIDWPKALVRWPGVAAPS